MFASLLNKIKGLHLGLEMTNLFHIDLQSVERFFNFYFYQFEPALQEIFFCIFLPSQFALFCFLVLLFQVHQLDLIPTFYSFFQELNLLAIPSFILFLVLLIHFSCMQILHFFLVWPFFIFLINYYKPSYLLKILLIMDAPKSTKSTKLIIVLFLIFGFIYTFCNKFIIVAYKLQGSQVVQEGVDGSISKTFFHPYMQGLSFFMGQSLCALLIFFYPSQKQKTYSNTIFIIPAVSDLFSVMLQCTALALISGSSFMMLKGASIITTLIFSHLMKDIDIKIRHLIGCSLAILGLIIVGLADILLSDKPINTSSSQDQQLVGYIIMVISLIFNGFLYAYEQRLLRKYIINPIQMVAWQGIYGTIISFFLVIILSFIKCPYTGNKCVYNKESVAYIELPSVYLSQIFLNFTLLLLVLSGMISNAFYNFYGATITNTLDSLTRSLLNACRTGLIWIFGIFITLIVDQQSPYRIQSLSFSVNLVKLLGFICIISGTLIYNKIIMEYQLQQLDLKWIGKTAQQQNLIQKTIYEQQMMLIQTQKQRK